MNIPEQVAPAYEYWQKFLETQITFWLKTSDKHTKEHCKRVLLYCLLIADQKKCLQRNGISSVSLLCFMIAAVRMIGWMWDMDKGQQIIIGSFVRQTDCLSSNDAMI